jgi:hypothetical protein
MCRDRSVIRQLRDDRARLSQTISALDDTARAYRVRLSDGQRRWAAETEALSVTRDNLRRLYQRDIQRAHAVGIDQRDIDAVSNIASVTSDSVIVPVYIDTLRRLFTSYSDPYTSISAIIRRDSSAVIDYQIRDSLTVYDYYVRHRLLWGLIRWRERQNKLKILSLNPHCRIVSFSVKKIIE